MPEGENFLGVPLVQGGQNLPPMFGIGLTDLQNTGGPLAPPAPPVPASLQYDKGLPTLKVTNSKSNFRAKIQTILSYFFFARNSQNYFEVTYPDAQLPLADPPLLEHSLEKKK